MTNTNTTTAAMKLSIETVNGKFRRTYFPTGLVLAPFSVNAMTKAAKEALAEEPARVQKGLGMTFIWMQADGSWTRDNRPQGGVRALAPRLAEAARRHKAAAAR